MHILTPETPQKSSSFSSSDIAPKKGEGCASGTPLFRGSLGIDAKYKYKTAGEPLSVDFSSGEIAGLVDRMEPQIQRFILQSVVRKLLSKSRTNNCLRVRHKIRDGRDATIKVFRSKEYGTASYGGLQTCGSVWQCPVCAAKISERRRAEVLAAMLAWSSQGGRVNLLTLTCPHSRQDNLVELLAKQAKALNYFWMDKHVKAVLAEMGNIGHIKATEVTHGRHSPSNNGFHPHYHIALFDGSGVPPVVFISILLDGFRSALYRRWAHACQLAGLGVPSERHGLDLRGGDEASKYMTKWGIDYELTKGHIKKSINGETPFDFLRALVADPTDRQAAALFIDYAHAFKGKRQLRWSKGLKKRFGIEEKQDDVLAAEQEEFSELLGRLDINQWRDVLAVEGRGALLSAACRGGWPAVEAYLKLIKNSGSPFGKGKGEIICPG